MSTEDQTVINEWFTTFQGGIRDAIQNDKELKSAKRLLYTWKDIFCSNIQEMPATDLIMYRVPTYANRPPWVTKTQLFNPEEVEYQKQMLPQLMDAEIISRCESPWSARTKFVQKKDSGLCMVHNFCLINAVMIKSNYTML